MPQDPTPITVSSRQLGTHTFTSTLTNAEALERLCSLVDCGAVTTAFAKSLVAQGRWQVKTAARQVGGSLSELQLRWVQFLVHSHDEEVLKALVDSGRSGGQSVLAEFIVRIAQRCSIWNGSKIDHQSAKHFLDALEEAGFVLIHKESSE